MTVRDWCRLAIALLGACGATTAAPVRQRATGVPIGPACDAAAWRAALGRPTRARRPHGPPLYVVTQDAQTADLADATVGAIVVRRTRIAELARVVVREVEVVPKPEVAPTPDAGVWLEPGFELPAGSGWLSVGLDNGIYFSGFVPATASGVFWDGPAVAAPWDPSPLGDYSTVRGVPDASAPEIASVTRGEPARLATDAPAWGWTRFEARAHGVRVVGWIDREPHRPSALAGHAYDFSDVLVEGSTPAAPTVTVRPPLDTCIRAAPRDDAAAIGLVTGELVALPSAVRGWIRVELVSAFGRIEGYIPAT